MPHVVSPAAPQLPTPQLPNSPAAPLPFTSPLPAAHTPLSSVSAAPLHVGQSALEAMDALSENHHVPAYEYVASPLTLTLHETASPTVLA